MKKMRPYLLGSRGMVRFFVVIKLERADTRPGKHLLTEAPESSQPVKRCRTGEAGAIGAADLSEAQRDGESLKLAPLQDEEEWIPGQSKGKVTKAFISVYTSKVNLSTTGVPTRAVETIFESLVGSYSKLVLFSTNFHTAGGLAGLSGRGHDSLLEQPWCQEYTGGSADEDSYRSVLPPAWIHRDSDSGRKQDSGAGAAANRGGWRERGD